MELIEHGDPAPVILPAQCVSQRMHRVAGQHQAGGNNCLEPPGVLAGAGRIQAIAHPGHSSCGIMRARTCSVAALSDGTAASSVPERHLIRCTG